MASKFISASSFIAAATLGGAAVAGGYVAPVEPVPVVVTPPVEISDWAGAYVGGSLGYSLGGDDVVGAEAYDADKNLLGRANNLGQVDVEGVNAGLHAGYRWQRDNWVYGPEIGIEGGTVDAQERLVNGDADTGVDLESSVNYIASLRFKTGYVVNPQTLVYGTVGVAHGDFDYEAAYEGGSQTKSFSDTGWSAGLGVERKLNEKLSMFAEWEFRGFGKTTVEYEVPGTTDTITTQATPEHHNVKLGVNYRF